MKDLTAHSIGKHILQMALPIAAGMLFQTLYFLIDLYFVARLGDAAIAGVHGRAHAKPGPYHQRLHVHGAFGGGPGKASMATKSFRLRLEMDAGSR